MLRAPEGGGVGEAPVFTKSTPTLSGVRIDTARYVDQFTATPDPIGISLATRLPVPGRKRMKPPDATIAPAGTVKVAEPPSATQSRMYQPRLMLSAVPLKSSKLRVAVASSENTSAPTERHAASPR